MTDSLSQEIAGLKAVAQGYAARHQRIENLAWPAGKRIAVNFTADFDAMLLRRLNNEPPMQLAKGEFGGRVGIWRLIELFDSHDIKATVFTVGRICELYPQALKAAVRSGHELADHMWEHRVPKEPDVERDHLRKTAAALERFSGRRPVGSRSHHTPTLLREEGYIYNSHGAADHRPYYVLDDKGAPCVLELPFHFAIDDAMFFSLRLVRLRQRRAAPLGHGSGVRHVVGGLHAAVSAGRLSQHLPASLRVGARAAHRHARSPDRAHEDAARRVVCDLRGGGAPLPRQASAEARCGVTTHRGSWAMPWKDGYTISDEKSLADARCPLARGKALRRPHRRRPERRQRTRRASSARDIRSAAGRFGASEGLDLVLAALARHGLKATFAVPAVMAEIDPARIKALIARGHEVAAHGFKHEDVSALSRERGERARIDLTTKILTDVTGRRPAGWFSLPRQKDPFAGGTISPNTMDLLIEAGYAYMGNGLADDIPHYWVTDFASRRAILTLPYYYHFDDQFFCMFPRAGLGAGKLRHAVPQLARRARRPVQARPLLHDDAASPAHRLVQPHGRRWRSFSAT